MRDIVVGMAGHIDHGKTTVVKYLTGVDTDTLPEEKERGMTINLGFTQIKFKDGSRVGIVDVPGHEKFIKNMSAGASGVDYLILVIACDDGIMPQTREHFQIGKLFGVKKGMLLLTKRDLVGEKRYEEVRVQCKGYFKGSFLEDSPLLSVSIRDLTSYERVKETLYEEIKKIKIEEEKKYFKMDVDRVFSLKGFGCIVTGTIKSGEIHLGDNLTIYPQNKKVRVKGIESHGEKKDSLRSGNRCAINLAGVESSEIKRGDIVAESLLVGDRIDCRLTLLENSPKLKNNHRIRLNIGTDEIIGRVKIYEKNYILGGEEAFVQLQLECSTGGVLGEKGIVRNYSPITTVGGIELLFFPKEEFNRKDLEHVELLKVLSKEDEEKKVEELIKKDFELEDIFILLGKKVDLKKYFSSKKIYLLDKKIIHSESIEKKMKELVEYLDNYHRENSLVRGVMRTQIKAKYFQNFSQKDFNMFFNIDIVKEKIKIIDEHISLIEFKVKLNKEEKAMKEEIFTYYKGQKFEIYSYSHYLNMTKNRDLFKKLHGYMLEEGFIQYLEKDFFILTGFLNESIKIVKSYLKENKTLEIKKARELFNNDRESAILILRKLDTLKITKNIDGVRALVIE